MMEALGAAGGETESQPSAPPDSSPPGHPAVGDGSKEHLPADLATAAPVPPSATVEQSSEGLSKLDGKGHSGDISAREWTQDADSGGRGSSNSGNSSRWKESPRLHDDLQALRSSFAHHFGGVAAFFGQQAPAAPSLRVRPPTTTNAAAAAAAAAETAKIPLGSSGSLWTSFGGPGRARVEEEREGRGSWGSEGGVNSEVGVNPIGEQSEQAENRKEGASAEGRGGRPEGGGEAKVEFESEGVQAPGDSAMDVEALWRQAERDAMAREAEAERLLRLQMGLQHDIAELSEKMKDGLQLLSSLSVLQPFQGVSGAIAGGKERQSVRTAQTSEAGGGAARVEGKDGGSADGGRGDGDTMRGSKEQSSTGGAGVEGVRRAQGGKGRASKPAVDDGEEEAMRAGLLAAAKEDMKLLSGSIASSISGLSLMASSLIAAAGKEWDSVGEGQGDEEEEDGDEDEDEDDDNDDEDDDDDDADGDEEDDGSSVAEDGEEEGLWEQEDRGLLAKEEYSSYVGITDDVVAFAFNLSLHPETWLSFPLPYDNLNNAEGESPAAAGAAKEEASDGGKAVGEEAAGAVGGGAAASSGGVEGNHRQPDQPLASHEDFAATEAQRSHMEGMARAVPRLLALHSQLCPMRMSARRFWTIYFVLLHSRIPPDCLPLLCTPPIRRARSLVLEALKNSTPSSVDGGDPSADPATVEASSDAAGGTGNAVMDSSSSVGGGARGNAVTFHSDSSGAEQHGGGGISISAKTSGTAAPTTAATTAAVEELAAAGGAYGAVVPSATRGTASTNEDNQGREVTSTANKDESSGASQALASVSGVGLCGDSSLSLVKGRLTGQTEQVKDENYDDNNDVDLDDEDLMMDEGDVDVDEELSFSDLEEEVEESKKKA